LTYFIKKVGGGVKMPKKLDAPPKTPSKAPNLGIWGSPKKKWTGVKKWTGR